MARNSLRNHFPVNHGSSASAATGSRRLLTTLNPGDGDPRSPGAEGLPGRPPALVSVSAEQHFLEGLPEDFVEDRVEDRIDHRTGVAQPSGQIEDLVIDLPFTVGTHG